MAPFSIVNFAGANRQKIVAISCGGDHAIAITSSHEPYAWGRNDEGQLGLGYLSDYCASP